jgi:beta-N-acetylhexosaminidase
VLIATDQEHGVVSRVWPPATQFPGNMALGATRRPGDTFAAYGVTARELGALGINQNYAPVADVNVNPLNPVIGVRSFGEDPQLVSDMTAAAVSGTQRAGSRRRSSTSPVTVTP